MENSSEHRPRSLGKRWLLAVAGLPVIAALCLGSWVLFTESGLRMTADTLLGFAGENIHVGRIRGRLAGTVHLEKVDVLLESFALSIDRMELELDLSGLTFLELRIREVSASGVRISVAGSSGAGARETEGKKSGLGLLRKLVLSNLSIEDVVFHPGDSDKQFLANRVQFSGETDGRSMRVRKLFLSMPDGELILSGTVDLAQDLSVESDLSWSLRLKDNRTIKGGGTIKGPLSTLNIRQNVTEPFRGEVVGVLDYGGENPSWEAEGRFRDLDPGWFLSRENMGNLTGQISGGGSLKSFFFEGNAEVSGLPGMGGQTAEISIEGERQPDLVRIKRFSVSIRDSSLRMEAAGTFTDPGHKSALDFTATWQNLVWPLDGTDPLVLSPAGEVAARGTLSEYHLEVKGSLGGGGFLPVPFYLQASGNLDSLESIDMKLSPPDGEVQIRGSFQWSGRPEWSFQAEGHGLYEDILEIGALTANAQGAAMPFEISTAGLGLEGFRFGSLNIENFQLSGTGSMASHVVEGIVKSGPLSAEISINGGFRDGGWDGSIHTETLGGFVAVEASVRRSKDLVFSGRLAASGLNSTKLWTPGPSMLNINGSFTGSLVSGNLALDLDLGSFDGWFSGRPFSGTAAMSVSGDRAELLRFRVESGGGFFSASGKVEEELDLRWEMIVPDLSELLPGLSGDLNGKGRITGLRAEPVFTVSLDSDGFQGGGLNMSGLVVSAEVHSAKQVVYSVEAWSGPLRFGKWEAASSAVRVRGSGNRQAGTIHIRDMDGMELIAEVGGDLSGESWSGTLDADFLGGEVAARIGLFWGDELKAQVSGYANHMNPGVLHASLPGNVSLLFQLEGKSASRGNDLEVRISDLQGVLRNQSVRGSGHMEWSSGTLSVHELELGLGDSNASATASWSEDSLSGSWLISVPDMGEILPGYGGTLSSSGEIFGSALAPALDVFVTASEISGKGWSVGEAQAEAVVIPTDAGQNRLRVQGRNILLFRNTIEEMSLAVFGSSGREDVTFKAVLPDSVVDIQGAGYRDGGRWSWSLKKAQWAFREGETWALEGEPSVVLSNRGTVVGPVCLGSGDSRLCTEGQWKGDEITGSIRLLEVPLSRLISFTGLQTNLASSINGRAEARLRDGRLSGSMELASTPGSILYPTGFGNWAQFDFDGADFSAILDLAGLKSSFSVRIGGGKGDFIEGRLLVPGLILPSPVGTALELVINGNMKGRLTDLAVVRAFFPDLDKPSGILSADFDLGGTLGKPRINGGVRLDEGDVLVVPLGLNLKEVKGTITGKGQDIADLTLELISGQGRLDVEGSLRMNEGQQPTGQIRITGDRLTAARIPQVFLVLSPDLLLEGNNASLKLTGTVKVPEAHLTPRELPESGGPSPDVEIVDAEAKIPQRREIAARADITVTLEDKVMFEGSGITGRITGTIRVIEEPGKVTSGTGELNILEGQYRAYGQRLTIEKGRLIFSGGPLQNPGLDIRAVRHSGEVMAGISVYGTLMKPEIFLFSDPPMDQADALSYLLLGKPLRRASGDEGQTLATAALTMGLAKGETLAQRIGEAFGLEEVSVQTESDVQQAALVVGRYLLPRVYVRYGVGLFQTFSIFQFGYRMSDKFLLQGETGAYTGADLLYNIEK